MYKDLKVTSGEVAANNVKSAPDRLQGTATENKNVFDKLVELFVAKYNSLLDELDDNEIKAIDPITISGYTISHANSGVTQGMYGTDQEQDPQHGEKFIVPYIIVDEHGHIVSAGNSEVQLPSGGGGGTSDYDDLTDKPSINSVTLSGNKSASDLSLASASHTHTKSDISDFPSLATVATTGDYDDLSDKPSIPTKTSDLTNDSGYITGYTETDPVFTASAAHGITNSDISGWNNKSDFSGDYDDLTNKPTIPTKVSDLNNDSGFISSETDPVFSASAASGISSSDISSWNGKSTVSLNRKTTSGTNIADLTINGTTTQLYAPSGGGGTSDYDSLSNRPQINSTTLTGDKSSSDLGLASASHSHTVSDVTDFPSLATVATTGDYDDLSDKPTIPTKVSDLNNDSGFISSEIDPIFLASVAAGITSSDISNWNGKTKITESTGSITFGTYKIMWGSESINPSSGTSGSGTFAAPYRKDSSSIALSFSDTPYVWLQVNGAWTGTTMAFPIDVDATSFKIRLLSSSTSNSARAIRWLALGKA